jgi:FdhD protein
VTTHSSCGLCGRQTIEGLKTDVPPLRSTVRVRASVLADLPGRLRQAQVVFGTTGGLHAAGLFDSHGTLREVAEDVGRHNAVDKVIGRRIMADALPLSSDVLFVSGRTSFEIVQKAALAGVPVVAAVSAPSSLAVDLANEIGITLVGFVRDGSFNVYARPERIEWKGSVG